MEAYTYSDFRVCVDSKRAVSGVVMMLVKGMIIWPSRIRAVTASVTSEAEYVALSEAVQEVITLRQV